MSCRATTTTTTERLCQCIPNVAAATTPSSALDAGSSTFQTRRLRPTSSAPDLAFPPPQQGEGVGSAAAPPPNCAGGGGGAGELQHVCACVSVSGHGSSYAPTPPHTTHSPQTDAADTQQPASEVSLLLLPSPPLTPPRQPQQQHQHQRNRACLALLHATMTASSGSPGCCGGPSPSASHLHLQQRGAFGRARACMGILINIACPDAATATTGEGA